MTNETSTTAQHADTPSRPYRMRKRREHIEGTRQRIVEAAVELHGSVGPAQTTFSAVAERAGVQRSTVYRHFPDEEALFGACTTHWLAAHPWPTPANWAEPDPRARLGRGLRELYRFFDENELMLANSYRDIEVMPNFVGELMRQQVAAMHEALLAPWPADANRERLGKALWLAIDFRAWQALDDAGLAPSEAATLMADMVSSAA